MNYLALRHIEPSKLKLKWLRVMPEEKAAELIQLVSPGDTLHKVPDEASRDSNILSDYIDEQILRGEYVRAP